VVSGDKLGAMNSPVIIDSHGTEVRFCCHDCVATFNENPAKYLAKLKAAAQK
jgi:YHS domain-containing protein